MRFNVSGNTLKQRLQGVGKVVNPKNALSILDNFLLTVKGETLTILGSDQENVVVSTVEITDVEGEGSIAVPARRLLDMMKELPDVNLKFEIDPETQRIELDYWSGHFSFMGFPGAEFPMQKEREADSRRVLIPADVLRDCIEHALYAVSTDTIRPVMTGVCFDFREDKMLLASSDTHKLVKCETTMVQPGFESRFVMPAKACGLLKALLDKVEGDVVLTMDSKGATFEFDNSSVSCVFITGNYPPYEKCSRRTIPIALKWTATTFAVC